MDNELTPMEFRKIQANLERISDTWATLWLLLNLTHSRVSQLLHCRYQDVEGNMLNLPAHGILAPRAIPLSPTAVVILRQRRIRYPYDIYIFQSHSRRVRSTCRPVTVIAFNAALKTAARTVTNKQVSSKSAITNLQSRN